MLLLGTFLRLVQWNKSHFKTKGQEKRFSFFNFEFHCGLLHSGDMCNYIENTSEMVRFYFLICLFVPMFLWHCQNQFQNSIENCGFIVDSFSVRIILLICYNVQKKTINASFFLIQNKYNEFRGSSQFYLQRILLQKYFC